MKLAEFTKKKDFLICVDSDGCAMDTMDIKHIKCFGPCMVAEWNLKEWAEPILARWNEINLYTLTRGINRFQGLLAALLEINDQYKKIDGIEELEQWVETTPEHSNDSLKAELERTGSDVFKKALDWSVEVNKQIAALPEEEKKPYEGVKEALEYAHQYADIAIVSSANHDALVEEWEMHGLLDSVDVMCSQNEGTKAFCIAELLKKGYSVSNVMMTGDAVGDMKAAQKNGVFYYPILVKHESESWKEFVDVAVQKLVKGEFAGNYQKMKIDEFTNNLSGK